MASYLVSGSAVPHAMTGDPSSVEDAVAGEDDVTVESAFRVGEDVQFTLRVDADDEDAALEVARRVADRVSPGSNVALVDEPGRG